MKAFALMTLCVCRVAAAQEGADPGRPDPAERNERLRDEVKLLEWQRQAVSPFGFVSFDLDEKNKLKINVSGGNVEGAASLGSLRTPVFGPQFSISNDGLSVGVGLSIPLIAQASLQVVVTPIADFGNIKLGGSYLSAGIEGTVRTAATLDAANAKAVEAVSPAAGWLYRGVTDSLFMSWPGADRLGLVGY